MCRCLKNPIKMLFIKNTIIELFSFALIFHVNCSNVCDECLVSRCEVRARTDAGWVCGRIRRADDGTQYASFRGVPYGKPPLGKRRFQELEPVDPWDGEFDATEDSPACPQTDFLYGRIPLQMKGQSEDCIYLDVHVSYARVSKTVYTHKEVLLPVLVFVHGGTFQSGSGLTDFYGPEYLMSRPIILISFNYRLNVFGFLSLGTHKIPGNQGLRDILTLLKWVQRNVAAFGGDPTNVTLMGQSAGATLVQILSLSEASRGLFKRIILMSCSAFSNYFSTSPKYAGDMANMFLQELGINSTDTDYIHGQLINMPLLNIMDANVAVQYKTGFSSFGPVAEPAKKFPGVTKILGADPISLIAKGRGKEYPCIISFTNHEMSFGKWYFTNKNILGVLQRDPTAIVQPRLLYNLPKNKIWDITRKIYKRYFDGGPPTIAKIMDYYTDLVFKHAAFKQAQWRVALGGAPMYIYQYSYEARHSIIKDAHWAQYTGAAHADDLTFIFRVNSLMGDYSIHPPRYKDDIMKNYMVFLITNFMASENPLRYGPEGAWPPVSKGRIQYYNIMQPLQLNKMEPTSEQIDMVKFFDSIDPETRNITARLGAGWN